LIWKLLPAWDGQWVPWPRVDLATLHGAGCFDLTETLLAPTPCNGEVVSAPADGRDRLYEPIGNQSGGAT